MLAADKLQLQSLLKQQATALKEKEFSLHHNNLMTVGTQAAVLAGMDITMFIEFHIPSESSTSSSSTSSSFNSGDHPPSFSWMHMILHSSRSLRLLHGVYYSLIVAALCANLIVVAHTTTLSVLGGSLALRGPDTASMMTATDALFHERSSVFPVFGLGVALTLASVGTGVWILLPFESAWICCTIAVLTSRVLWRNYTRMQRVFHYNEADTVDLRDLLLLNMEEDGSRGSRRGYYNHHHHNNNNSNHTNTRDPRRNRNQAPTPPLQTKKTTANANAAAAASQSLSSAITSTSRSRQKQRSWTCLSSSTTNSKNSNSRNGGYGKVYDSDPQEEEEQDDNYDDEALDHDEHHPLTDPSENVEDDTNDHDVERGRYFHYPACHTNHNTAKRRSTTNTANHNHNTTAAPSPSMIQMI